MLRTPDSPIDLMLRGWTHEDVQARTGIDIGYRGRRLRDEAKGIDRVVYKIEHVRARVSQEALREALDSYAHAGLDKVGLLKALGLGSPNLIELRELFEGLGQGPAFEAAQSAARTAAMRTGMVAKHGVTNAFALNEVQQRAAATREQRYGAAYTLAAGSSLAQQARETFAQNMHDEEFRAELAQRKAATNLERRGVDHPMRDPQVKVDLKQRWLDRHGVEHPSQRPKARQRQSRLMRVEGAGRAVKARQTLQDRYGVDNFQQSAQARLATSKRMGDPSRIRASQETKRAKGTFNTSEPEEALYAMLVERFGADDVHRQHRDEERYPWAADFWVESRDLFIELNATWTHGGGWYDANDPAHLVQVQAWAGKGTKFYDAAIQQWTVRDVAKRRAAAQHALNLVVLWDAKLLDAQLWLALGAPDARDHQREYDWLPWRELVLPDVLPSLGAGSKTASAIARWANGEAFYARERALWEADVITSRGRERGRLYANRWRYLGKLPHELSDLEILRGLGISGRVRAYTVFDNAGMKQIIEDHRPRSIYDPCAGWGERLVTAAALGIDYLGADINPAVVAGHERIAAAYGLQAQRSVHADASAFDQRNGDHDMVLTCPPYGDAEIYTQAGAENFDKAGFVAWWAAVVAMAVSPSTRTFAYQVNQRWREAMNEALLKAGWRLVDQIDVGRGRVGHFNRTAGRKRREYEQMQVFVR